MRVGLVGGTPTSEVAAVTAGLVKGGGGCMAAGTSQHLQRWSECAVPGGGVKSRFG